MIFNRELITRFPGSPVLLLTDQQTAKAVQNVWEYGVITSCITDEATVKELTMLNWRESVYCWPTMSAAGWKAAADHMELINHLHVVRPPASSYRQGDSLQTKPMEPDTLWYFLTEKATFNNRKQCVAISRDLEKKEMEAGHRRSKTNE